MRKSHAKQSDGDVFEIKKLSSDREDGSKSPVETKLEDDKSSDVLE
jgi:hypothetical protein